MDPAIRYSQNVLEILPKKDQDCLNDWKNGLQSDKDFYNTLKENNQDRYRNAKNTDKCIMNIIFEKAFESSPKTVIDLATGVKGKSFYLLSKRVIYIDLPNLIANAFKNKIIKVILTAGVGYFFFKTGYWAYRLTNHFVAAPAAAYLTNNISILRSLITMNLLNHRIAILIGEFLSISSTVIFKRNFFLSSKERNIRFFLISYFLNNITFTCKKFDDIGIFFIKIAENGEKKRLEISKNQAKQLWIQGAKKVLQKNSPPLS